jgi:hypothetical protein
MPVDRRGSAALPAARGRVGSTIVTDAEREYLAEQVRAALIRAALAAYEDAAVRGLCGEGAWEVAVAAMRRLDLRRGADPLRSGARAPAGGT